MLQVSPLFGIKEGKLTFSLSGGQRKTTSSRKEGWPVSELQNNNIDGIPLLMLSDSLARKLPQMKIDANRKTSFWWLHLFAINSLHIWKVLSSSYSISLENNEGRRLIFLANLYSLLFFSANLIIESVYISFNRCRAGPQSPSGNSISFQLGLVRVFLFLVFLKWDWPFNVHLEALLNDRFSWKSLQRVSVPG